MEHKKENNFAYIDGANLHNSVLQLGWKLDYKKFRVWLQHRYHVVNAYIFIGLIVENKNLYVYLQEAGFILVYREITYDGTGKVKGNCDALLVLKTVCNFYEKNYDKAVIVASDGDYAELVQFLKEKEALRMVVSPNNKCSYLLRKQNIPLLYIDTQRKKVERINKSAL
ncbi:MAG: hypothetical protein A2908_00230 [Candidatus Staskawiczbacteria bacterium RIFCSPLOWO2_01_FULL_38_12b]|uniref:NYN domain-containing protein n=1 Tax=Candidatus Staskawiczbacteria bacterium RIFCSPLOWO2_01_FULL_38_12b TaxID=1802214 RepID=A0A1G2IDI5_9BACT|nr:MAG: hypothetical protein A2908_00230 [Candidatus Staskawiczbacteria bacterium RIFCSPLOWO2_01_FULL_38_12b]